MHIRTVPLKPNSLEVVICGSITSVIINLSSAATRSVLNQERVDSRHVRIETGMSQRYSAFTCGA